MEEATRTESFRLYLSKILRTGLHCSAMGWWLLVSCTDASSATNVPVLSDEPMTRAEPRQDYVPPVSPPPVSAGGDVPAVDPLPMDASETALAQLGGTWTGTTGDGREIAFTVNDAGAVDGLIVLVALRTGAASCVGPALASAPPQSIIDGRFQVPATFLSSSVVIIVTGTFSADGMTASGSYEDLGGMYVLTCGDEVTFGVGSLLIPTSWTATRRPYVCPSAGDGRCDEPEGSGRCFEGTDADDCRTPELPPPAPTDAGVDPVDAGAARDALPENDVLGQRCGDIGCPPDLELPEEVCNGGGVVWFHEEGCAGDLCVGSVNATKTCSRPCSSDVDCANPLAPLRCAPEGCPFGAPPDVSLAGQCIPADLPGCD